MISSVKDLYPDIKERYDLSGFSGQAYTFPGRDLLLRSNSPELIELLNEVYHGFRADDTSGIDPITLYLLKERDRFLTVDPGFDSFICPDPDRVLSFWGAQLMCNHLYRSYLLFLHGSVLERNKKTYLFLGESNAGKSTTILKLREEGFIFFSDEFAPIDLTSGLIHPFPRSFLLRSDGIRLIPKLSDGRADLPCFNDYQELDRATGKPVRRFIIIPELIYQRTGENPAPVGGIFFLDKFNPEETAISPLPSVKALEKLLDHFVNSRYLSIGNRDRAFTAIAAILKASPAFSLRPGPLNEDSKVLAQTIITAVDYGQPIETGDLSLVTKKCRELLTG